MFLQEDSECVRTDYALPPPHPPGDPLPNISTHNLPYLQICLWSLEQIHLLEQEVSDLRHTLMAGSGSAEGVNLGEVKNKSRRETLFLCSTFHPNSPQDFMPHHNNTLILSLSRAGSRSRLD